MGWQERRSWKKDREGTAEKDRRESQREREKEREMRDMKRQRDKTDREISKFISYKPKKESVWENKYPSKLCLFSLTSCEVVMERFLVDLYVYDCTYTNTWAIPQAN